MAILRLKQADGTWAEVPALKGDPGPAGSDGKPGRDGVDGYTPVRGTDYWTDADKAEIKGYVDEAVKDIDIPTAAPYVLPVATADTLGGVKVGTGLVMSGEKLGIAVEKPMRLINSVTVAEDVAIIDITSDVSGQPFAAQKVFVVCTPGAGVASDMVFVVRPNNETVVYCQSGDFSKSGAQFKARISLYNQRLFVDETKIPTSVGGVCWAEAQLYGRGIGVLEMDAIRQVKLQALSGAVFPAGTTLEVYEMGVL